MKDYIALLKSQTPAGVKLRQKLVISAGLVMLIGIVYVVAKPDQQVVSPDQPKQESVKKVQKIRLDSSGSTLNQQEVWVDKLTREMELLRKQNEEMQKVITELSLGKMQQGMGTLNNMPPTSASPQNPNALNTEHLIPGQHGASLPVPQNMPNTTPFKGETKIEEKSETKTDKQKLMRISFNLDGKYSKQIKRSVDHYVPAGTFVRGALTSGIVASTSVQASANPQPIHIQLTDLGNLPRGFKADVKQCFLIGSGFGDLASERVFMRLEKLSCVERKTAEIIELDVDGYVTGEDGANGLRGIVVDRSGPVMRNAFLGGFLSGVGNFFGQQNGITPTSIGQGGVAMINPLTAQQMAQAGAGKGLGNAMEKLSEFYIKRAEQLQPVIEIEPGRMVTIVFKGGFDMNQTLYRQSLKDKNDMNRRDISAHPDQDATHNGQQPY